MSDDSRVFLNPETLKGIAHPIRVRLLGLLREDGPSTATRLAERIGQSSGVTSYHLRQLALHGFVVDDAGRGNARERWWRARHRQTTLDGAAARAAPAESEAYMRAIAAQYADRTDQWLGELPTLPEEWHEGVTLSDYRLRLRPAESAELLAAIERLIAAYRSDDPDIPAPGDAERVVVQLQLMPFIRPTAEAGLPGRAADGPEREADGPAPGERDGGPAHGKRPDGGGRR